MLKMEILSIEGLHKSFGDKQVLRGLDLSIPENSIYGFVGRNGAGKTTTMKMMLGLLPCDSGEIRICGERVTYGQSPTNRYVGYLPDVPVFYPFLTAREYLSLCGESLHLTKSECKERSEELLSLVGLSNERRRIKGFSRGMKQRLGVAQALLSKPQLLICDEPSSALDPIGRREILDLLLRVKEQTTILFSTHLLSDVERICTDVAFLHDGKIALSGKVDDLRRRYGAEEFSIEMADESGYRFASETFSDAVFSEGLKLVFRGDERRAYEVLDRLRGERHSIRSFARSDASLEALFMEVVGK